MKKIKTIHKILKTFCPFEIKELYNVMLISFNYVISRHIEESLSSKTNINLIIFYKININRDILFFQFNTTKYYFS